MVAYVKKEEYFGSFYNEEEVDEMILHIRDSFIPAFIVLENTLRTKMDDAEGEW